MKKWLYRLIGLSFISIPVVLVFLAMAAFAAISSALGWLESADEGRTPSVVLQEYIAKISGEIAALHGLYDSYILYPGHHGYDYGYHEAGSEVRIRDDIEIDLLSIITVKKIKLLQSGAEVDPDGVYDLKVFDSISDKEIKKTFELFYTFSTRSDTFSAPPCVDTKYGQVCTTYRAVYVYLKNHSTESIMSKLNFNDEDRELFDFVQKALAEILIGKLPTHVDSTPNSKGFVWPVPDLTKITSPFGWRTHPITKERQYHSGVDISGYGAEGKPVIPIYPGKVIEVGFNGIEGNYVKIRSVINGKDFDHVYMHLLLKNVEVDQDINYGDVLGAVGSTGRSTGPHLHLSLYVNGSLVNPLEYVG